MRSHQLIAFAFIQLLLVPHVVAHNVGTIIVFVVDPFGNTLKQGSYSVGSSGHKVASGVGMQLADGRHDLQVMAPGYYSERLEIAQTEQFQIHVVGLIPAIAPKVSGRVTTISIKEYENYKGCNLLLLTAVYLRSSAFASIVSPGGRAGLPSVPGGIYSVVLSGDSGLCGSAVTGIVAGADNQIALYGVDRRRPNR